MTAPPFVQSVPHQVVDLTEVSCIAFAQSGGKAFTVSRFVTGNAQLFVFTNLNNLAQFIETPVPGGIAPRIISAVYVPSQDTVYVGTRITTATNKKATVYAYQVSTGVWTTTVNAGDFGSNPSTTGSVGTPMVTDGTFIYSVLATASGTNGIIAKFNVSDGAAAAAPLTLSAAPGGSASLCQYVGFVNPTTLIAYGTNGAGAWASIIPTSIASVTNVIDVPGIVQPSNYPSVIGTNLWLPDGLTGNQFVYKIAADLSLVTPIADGCAGGAYGTFYDGTYLWMLDNAFGTVVVMDPGTGNIVRTYSDLTGFFKGTSYIARGLGVTPSGYMTVSYDSSAVQTSKAYLVPFADASAKPPMLGRGSC